MIFSEEMSHFLRLRSLKLHKSVENLSDILDKTNDWLKFAEAKNGALLALNCAISFGVLRILSAIESLSLPVLAYASISILMLATGAVINLLSLLPRLTPPWWVMFPKDKTNVNVLYFGDICGLTEKKFLEHYYLAIGEQGQYTNLEKQYANQIVTNSKISFIKYKQFSTAVWFTLSALITPLGAWLLSLVKE